MANRHSKWLQSQYARVACHSAYTTSLEALICDESIHIARDFDLTQLQESWSWRNVYLARELAKMLIDDQGEINPILLEKAIFYIENHFYSLGPDRYHDHTRQQHLLKILKLFHEDRAFPNALKKIFKPMGHQGADRLIKETLMLPNAFHIDDRHARQAAFAALLTFLRQNVGSCFATAPAVLIQQDQPLQFLTDIAQLLGTGRLVRVYEGKEHAVPLSMSWGMGDLLRPIFLSTLGENPIEILASSPGLQEALGAAGCIDPHAGHKNIEKQTYALLIESGLQEEKRDPFFVITADQILKKSLLRFFHLTNLDISEFKEHIVQGPIASRMLQTTHVQGGSKALNIGRYWKAYEVAKSAFKALTENALLKAWEFTLASLAESKADFAKWNLYTSLGVHPNEAHGIGASLYVKIQEKIAYINEEMSKFQSQYDHLFAQSKYLEGRISNATESELGWIRAEYQIRRQEINRVLSERDAIYEKGERLQNLYPLLIKFYGEKIPDYFQEVYDAQMHDLSPNPYDDAPAGFRLIYKHGRANPSLWTLIHSAAEYIEHLTSFFISTEIDLSQLPACESLENELSELVTTVILTIKTPEFLENSFARLARAYHEPIVSHPLENLDKVKRKPWSYISGGTMETLVNCYWGNAQKPREVKRWVESENEYLAFLIESIKELPVNIQHLYLEDEQKCLLAFSPTHAFNCKPGWKLFKKAWESDIYPYTWIKNYWLAEQKKFLYSQLLNRQMMDHLIHHLLLFIPAEYRSLIAHLLKPSAVTMAPKEFREWVIQTLSYERWLRAGNQIERITEEMDHLLYQFLPFFPEYLLSERLNQIFEQIDPIEESIKKTIPDLILKIAESVGRYHILTAKDLRNFAKAVLIEAFNTTRTTINFHQLINQAMQDQQFCYPEPFLFADTNWVKNVFGFILNPGTEKLELWRFDETGVEGRPMNTWKPYLHGKEGFDWGLYINPHQYGQF